MIGKWAGLSTWDFEPERRLKNNKFDFIEFYFISAQSKDSKLGQKTNGECNCTDARLIHLKYKE